MSETAAAPADGGEAPKAKSKGPIILAGVVVVALAAGGAAGAFVVAPVLAPAAAMASPAPKAKAKAHAADEGEEGAAEDGEAAEGEGEDDAEEHGKKEEKGKEGGHGAGLFKLDNMIVNPAGSDGSRYVMLSIAIEVADEAAKEALKEKEIQMKDAVITVLEAEPLSELVKPGARNELKVKLAKALKPVIKSRKPPKVFVPQYVIQ
ncbi:MAG: flagellar basal body-associated FliL family protein [Gemmatimonadales bacterium]|nr:flagellar basal body-associated FliL family protein [Gemmatimonadales bacterium]